jgi:membrane fusion protein (multidrug efflux system)
MVEKGIAPGALVITDNLMKLRDGAPVVPHSGPGVAATALSTNSLGR